VCDNVHQPDCQQLANQPWHQTSVHSSSNLPGATALHGILPAHTLQLSHVAKKSGFEFTTANNQQHELSAITAKQYGDENLKVTQQLTANFTRSQRTNSIMQFLCGK